MRLTRSILTVSAILFVQLVGAQKISSANRWFDSISTAIKTVQELGKRDSFEIINKSELSAKISGQLRLDTPALVIKKPAVPRIKSDISLPKKTMLDFKGGFVNYNWNFRSNIDTPFQEKNLSQHFLSTNLNFTIAQNIPIIVSYYDRESNSKYFRDYRDFRIEFNTQEFNRLQVQRLSAYTDQLLGQIQNPLTKPSLNYATKELEKIENWKNQRSTQNKLIRAKVIVLEGGTFDTLTNSIDTTTLSKAKAFIGLYDEIIHQTEKLGQYRDSLQRQYVSSEKEIAFIKKIVSGNQSGIDKKETLSNVLAKHGIQDKRLEKLYSAASSIKTLAVGRTAPNYSELTLKNVNVKGINFEYSRGIYFAFSAGAIDYRARDFFYSKAKRKPQYVYAARLGYGQRERTHFFFTAFKGRKQVLSSAETPAIDVYGLSFESQIAISKNHKLIGETAQSASPSFINSSGTSKPTFNIKDEKNRAYSIKLNSYFPRSRSRLEAFYKYRGINYQNFTSYYTNAALSQWSVKADQYLLNRLLHISASVAKNTYENPYLLTRYNGNTVFENLTATFRKSKLPSVTIGYMPSSQLSDINGQIYENFYQALNLSVNHQYKIGIAKAVSLFSFNQFYNSSNDTGFLYYNAKNYFFSQHFDFLSYTTDVNIARTNSRDYMLTVLDAGIGARIRKQSTIGFGVKINQLNNRSLKVGLYGSEKISIPKLGELSAWIEKCYLPGWKQELVKTEFYNIGFFRVIN